jgi:aryl-alcohol dehydrogenase-like predicted oxidoreductase
MIPAVSLRLEERWKQSSTPKKAGKVRFVGFTGYKSPDIHLKMLDTAASHKFHFDTVQMPLNVMDAHYESFEKKVLPVLLKDNIGVLGMKPMGDPFILESKTVTALECLNLRHESADQCCDHGMCFRSSAGCCSQFSAARS